MLPEIQLLYRKPFLLVYLGMASLPLLLLPLQLAWWLLRGQWRLCTGSPEIREGSSLRSGVSGLRELCYEATNESLRWFLLKSLVFALFWLLANYLFTYGLPLTDLASALTLEQLATVFVFILSVLALKEVVTVIKVAAVASCVAGAIIVAFSDHGAGSVRGDSPVVGDIFVIVSTLCTACFMVLYKRYLSQLTLPGVLLFLSTVGALGACVFWPGVLVLDRAGVEVFELPSGNQQMEIVNYVLLNLGLGVGFNLLLNVGIVLSTPLFMRVTIMCSIPITFLLDILFFGKAFDYTRLIGGVCVVLGFLVYTFFGKSRWPLANEDAVDVEADGAAVVAGLAERTRLLAAPV
eukprot:TRINITY_DN361_c0_g1_i4.p1 TRINITY_DN361_c0_g1~~TRINITY_DN361_c0_g1_i4.p1  ORF type:complete len:350 (-),score=11.01 TRINITY_DN361_c0_g1_i4:132-1181(-)